MRRRFFHKPVFHMHSEEKEKRVTWLELFYDLVYVAAFIQLGDAFSKNIGLLTFFKSAGIFAAMWMSWTGFTYYANRFTVDDFLHRILTFFQMFCVGAMAISIPSLLEGNPVLFGLSYSASLALVSVLYLRSWLQQPVGRDYTVYWGNVFLLSSTIWALSLLSDQYYYIGWIIGWLVIFIGPMTSRAMSLSEYYPFDLEHLSERYGLLTIIVLGESFVKVLTQLSSSNAGGPEILQASFALSLTCSIWWIYFDDVASAKLKKTKTSMVTWLFMHVPLQLSIVLMGVGIKKVVTIPLDTKIPLKYAILLGFSIGTALISTALIDTVTYRKNSELNEVTRVSIRFLAGVLIIFLSMISLSMNNLLFISFCVLVCLFQIVFDIFFSPYDIEEDEQVEPIQNYSKESLTSSTRQPGSRFDAEIIRKGLPTNFKKDLYFFFVEANWLQLFITFLFVYILSNVFFASLYLMTPNSITNSVNNFADAFFFSIQTMSTIGYGTLSPTGYYANLIVTIEAAFGIVGVACITGLIFAKISKPNANFLFTDKMINSPLNGKNSLSFRVSNTRGNDIIEASLGLSVLMDEKTIEGAHIRRIKDLNLVRSKTPIFKLSWTVIHEIDEESPLYNLDFNDDRIISFIVTLSGHDGTYSNTVFTQKTYYTEDIAKGMYFEDIMYYLPDGRMMIDYDKFNNLV